MRNHLFTAWIVLAAAHGAMAVTPVTAMPKLDINQLTGTWYEIQRLPDKPEKHCVTNAIVLYARSDKAHQLQVVNSCLGKDGYTHIRNANGKPAKKNIEDGRLKLTYVFPFSDKYWFLEIGAENDWALVGSPNHKTLWILSRKPTLSADLLTQAQAKATAEGFDVGKLVTVSQTGK